jgi:integrase
LSPMSRTSYGTGSVFQRGDGRWIGRISDGRGGRRYVNRATEQEARKALRELAKELAPSRSSTSRRGGERVAAYLARWLDDAAAAKVRPRTLEGYRQLVDQHIVPAVGHYRLGDLEAPDVQRMVNGMLRAGYAPGTARHALKVLKVALGQAERWGLVERNVARLVESPRIPRRELRRLTADEARAFLAATKDDPHWPIWVLALTTGMRQGEILSLRPQDVDTRRRTVTVAGTLRRVSLHVWERDETKTAQSRRTLPVADLAVEALRLAKRRATSTKLLFATATGRPLERTWVTKRFQLALEAQKLPSIPFHALRHTAAALLLDANGGDLRMVSAYLGHSTITTTVDLYGGVAEQARKGVPEAMDGIFGRTSEGGKD